MGLYTCKDLDSEDPICTNLIESDCKKAYYQNTQNGRYYHCQWDSDNVVCFKSNKDCCVNGHVDDNERCEKDEHCPSDYPFCRTEICQCSKLITTTTTGPGVPEFTGYAGIVIALIVVLAIALLIKKKQP